MKIAHTAGSHPDNPIRLGPGGSVPGPADFTWSRGEVMPYTAGAVPINHSAVFADLLRTTQGADNARRASDANVRRMDRCWRCKNGDRLSKWHAVITAPGQQPIVARRETWVEAMRAAHGWTGEGQRAYVHQAVR